MPPRTAARHTIVCHARTEAFALMTQVILGRLGYALWSAEDYEARRDDLRENDPPALRLVDERRLAEVEDEPGERPVPIIVLTGRGGATGADLRVVGAVRRPAGMHELYRLMQHTLEDHPRSSPRVPTHLRATCERRGRQWQGAILSLSENGCLLRSPEPLPLGTELDLRFDLPRRAPLELHADTAYQLLPDTGLVFNAVGPAERQAIQSFVTASLV